MLASPTHFVRSIFKVWHFLSIHTSETFIQDPSLSSLDYCSIPFYDLGKCSLMLLTGIKSVFADISLLENQPIPPIILQ